MSHSYFSPQTPLTIEVCLLVVRVVSPGYCLFGTAYTVEVAIIIIYIVGFISHKTTKVVCSKCAAGLVGLLNKANYSHVVIAAKQYQDFLDYRCHYYSFPHLFNFYPWIYSVILSNAYLMPTYLVKVHSKIRNNLPYFPQGGAANSLYHTMPLIYNISTCSYHT